MCRYLDDVAYKTVTSDSLANGKPFPVDNTPHFVILDTAVGGSLPFLPPTSPPPSSLPSALFPSLHLLNFLCM